MSQQPRQVLAQSPETQLPATQVWPDVQATQAPPFRPQADVVAGVMHMEPEQQPPAQLDELQVVLPPWHMPETQAWPVEQAWHELPFAPQAADEGVRQVLVASQQPPHEPGPHTDAEPPPAPPAPPAVPPALPAAPPPPAAPPVPATPPAPATLHLALRQDWPAGQRTHSLAPAPQAAGRRPSWHWPFSSQQPAQLETRQRGAFPHVEPKRSSAAATAAQRVMAHRHSTTR